MKPGTRFVHLVELNLDAFNFPDRSAFADVLARLALLGVMDCIELAIAPEGGGRLAFALHRDGSADNVRAALVDLVGADAVLACRTRPF
jgi:hypothetical protein